MGNKYLSPHGESDIKILQAIDFKGFLKVGTANALLDMNCQVDTNKNKKVNWHRTTKDTLIKIKKCLSCFAAKIIKITG